jgi:hypothetical protein
MRSQDEAMPEDPGAELSGKYDSAKRLEEYLLSAKPQDKIIQESQGKFYIQYGSYNLRSNLIIKYIICRN